MVQVDVFWSFALGAGFAAAAARQIKKDDKPFEGKYFVGLLLFQSLIFVPSGIILLWGFPEWETMQVGSYQTIPAWLAALFVAANITQAILGYWLATKLIKAGNTYGAYMLMLGGYFLMMFIIFHGWDGTGYQRFFYLCTGWGVRECIPWQPGVWSLKWFYSPVSITLMAMGVVVLAVLFKMVTDWVMEGYELAGIESKKPDRLIKFGIIESWFRLSFVYSIGSTIVASLLVRYLGWFFGFAIFSAIAWFTMIRPGGLAHRDIMRITRERKENGLAQETGRVENATA